MCLAARCVPGTYVWYEGREWRVREVVAAEGSAEVRYALGRGHCRTVAREAQLRLVEEETWPGA